MSRNPTSFDECMKFFEKPPSKKMLDLSEEAYKRFARPDRADGVRFT
jgi:hypothetical protein